MQLLDEIAAKFYGVRRRSGLQGIFGDLFKVGMVSILVVDATLIVFIEKVLTREVHIQKNTIVYHKIATVPFIILQKCKF